MTKIRIETQALSPGYEVLIEPGALDGLDAHVRAAAPAHAYSIIADSHVAALYGDRAQAALERTGAHVERLDFPAGEVNKTIATWADLCDRLLAGGLGRDGCIVALGGGVTTDLAGFVAATFMRGVPVVHVPTTLLAMIDAAIGGKTGVDTPAGKNLIGAFHQPRAVIADPTLLRTLSDRELAYGLAEAVKHGAIADAEYVAWIEAAIGAIREHRAGPLVTLVERSVAIKARHVATDERETGARAALNFGHTIGHAIERASGYAVAHGDAVAIGMVAEAVAGERAGITASGTAERLRAALGALGLPTSMPAALKADLVLAATRSDKKTRAGRQRYTLLARVGEVARPAGEWTVQLPDDVVTAALQQLSA